MKIIKAVLPILLAVITVTSCNGNASTEQANPTQVMGTAISLVWTEVSKTQPAIPTKTSTPANEESPLINPISTSISTESVWKYEYIATVPITSVNNSTQEEIANRLFTQWLNHFKTEEADVDHRLEDFELLNVVIYEKQLPDDFVAMVTFSVKPTRMSSWAAGNGISTDGVWPKPTEKVSFTFVVDGVESAIKQAKLAAGTKDVTVIGGASVTRQCIRAGLVDELQIDIMPILLGGGLRLFEGSETASMQLERLNVVNLPGGRIHLKFRV